MIYRIDQAVVLNQILINTYVYAYVRDCSEARDTLLLCNEYREHYTTFTAQVL